MGNSPSESASVDVDDYAYQGSCDQPSEKREIQALKTEASVSTLPQSLAAQQDSSGVDNDATRHCNTVHEDLEERYKQRCGSESNQFLLDEVSAHEENSMKTWVASADGQKEVYAKSTKSQQPSHYSNMAIPRNGSETLEYTAIQGSRVDITNLFALDTRRAATGLFKKLLLPDYNENAPFVDFVLKHIERDAIDFYKFLGFLCSYGNEAKNKVEVIQRTYYGKLLSFCCLPVAYVWMILV